eukprot:5605000-Prymnesium_polylepis.2
MGMVGQRERCRSVEQQAECGSPRNHSRVTALDLQSSGFVLTRDGVHPAHSDRLEPMQHTGSLCMFHVRLLCWIFQ